MNTVASGVPIIATEFALNLAAARLDGDVLAGREAVAFEFASIHRSARRGLDRVRHRCTPRHAAHVPVLQLPAGNEDKRVFGTRRLIAAAGHEMRTPVAGREAFKGISVQELAIR